MRLTLGQIAAWIHAEGDCDDAREALGYSIDSRTIAAGELFFAVQGERVDGHDYVEAALANGAVAAVVSMRWLAPSSVNEAQLLRVPDNDEPCVLHAMQQLAHRVRKHWGRRVIGVTGSAGKTTTKECIAQVLTTRYSVLKTEGNLNNHFGVPLTLLRLEPDHDIAVIEMGMNHAGEIAALARIAEPDWGVVSNVGLAHAEFFADGIEGIARAKKELIDSLPAALPAPGLAFLNADDERVRTFGQHLGARAILFGTSADAAVRAIGLEDHGFNGTGFTLHVTDRFGIHAVTTHLRLRLPGRHNVLNALAALAVGLQADVPTPAAIAALESMRPTERRGNVLTWRGAEIVNDTYNANPQALLSMIAALANTPAERRILIAGEMLELGAESARLHAECGAAAAEAGVDIVLGVRGLASAIVAAASQRGPKAEFVETPQAAGAWMQANLRAGDVVLLKASRGVRLEQALSALEPG
jgi:UDP-N-acetylmuramoyl-tripeptide--D-alanyl-D-alanine ligase